MRVTKTIISLLNKYNPAYNNQLIYTFSSHKIPSTPQEKLKMTKPHMVAPQPIEVKVEVGKSYWYCMCGLSKNQPYCDGSHQGTKFTPKKFTAQKQAVWLCQCRESDNKPFCDGSHNDL